MAEVVRSEATRQLVTMLRGSTPRTAERRGRARRSLVTGWGVLSVLSQASHLELQARFAGAVLVHLGGSPSL